MNRPAVDQHTVARMTRLRPPQRTALAFAACSPLARASADGSVIAGCPKCLLRSSVDPCAIRCAARQCHRPDESPVEPRIQVQLDLLRGRRKPFGPREL